MRCVNIYMSNKHRPRRREPRALSTLEPHASLHWHDVLARPTRGEYQSTLNPKTPWEPRAGLSHPPAQWAGATPAAHAAPPYGTTRIAQSSSAIVDGALSDLAVATVLVVILETVLIEPPS